mmetsp:Transcript_41305/g.132835  ORF Transcript_41305/g.132835 Transcript_41305/m.132835 type:complete len:231 (+) Transcript_41305:700-1392(+)
MSCSATNAVCSTAPASDGTVSACTICGAQPSVEMTAAHSKSRALSPPLRTDRAWPSEAGSSRAPIISCTASRTTVDHGSRTSHRLSASLSTSRAESTRESRSAPFSLSLAARATPSSRVASTKSRKPSADAAERQPSIRTTPVLSTQLAWPSSPAGIACSGSARSSSPPKARHCVHARSAALLRALFVAPRAKACHALTKTPSSSPGASERRRLVSRNSSRVPRRAERKS